MKASLESYAAKRDFSKTKEPRGTRRRGATEQIFVIQKHAARRLHYDLRLFHAGVLKSWAVPKGLSDDPAEKRLAVQTEDHPVAYADFEGTIPEGEYGAGTVEIWDRGTYAIEGDDDFGKSFAKGHLRIVLNGERTSGVYDLFRIKGEDETQWLLQKRSASARASPRKRLTPKESSRAPAGGTTPLPRNLKPQLATLVEKVPEGDDWWYEIKWDGYRVIATFDGQRCRLLTRNGHDWTERFPEVAEQLARVPASSFVVDGEAVVLDEDGRADFQALQNALKNSQPAPTVRYVLFDLLFLDGVDMRAEPLRTRHEALRHLFNEIGPNEILRFSERFRGRAQEIHRVACQYGLEGIIAKRISSNYQAGRQRSWLKIKCNRQQEFLLVGYTLERGNRNRLGALLLATCDNARLQYRGKVSAGVAAATLKSLQEAIASHVRRAPPPRLSGHPEDPSITWLDPVLTAEVAFQQLTEDGHLRHAVFKGLREDKSPDEIHLEKPAALPPSAADLKSDGRLELEGITITNPNREIDPGSAATKGELARYYADVGVLAMPYFRERPLSLVRCPQGRQSPCFFQKHFEESPPPHTRAVKLPEKGRKARYRYIASPAGLVACAQYGAIEFHGWGSRQDRPERPDQLIFDLDPSDEVRWTELLGAAFMVRDLLAEIGLVSFPKLTGGKGIHVCVPLVRRTDWEVARPFCRKVAEAMVAKSPKQFIAKSSKAARGGKIFIDYLRNGQGATAVLPFSARARPRLPIAVPASWETLDPKIRSDHWTIHNLPEAILSGESDPWAGFRTTRQSLTAERLAAVNEWPRK